MPRRKDSNQTIIVEALRQCGCTVQIIHRLGHGAPDILVGKSGINVLMEIKSGSNCLTPDELEWKNNWKGQYAVVRSPEQAIKVMEDMLEY